MNKKKIKGKFQFSRPAIVCGSLASVFYALGGVVTWWRHSIPQPLLTLVAIFSIIGPATCLIAPGIVVLRPISLKGYLAWGLYSIICSFLFILARSWCLVSYRGLPPPPWPLLHIFGLPTLFATVVSLTFGTFLAETPREWWVKLLSPLGAGSILLAVSLLSQLVFPPQNYVYIQRWEFVTIIIAGPSSCFFTWLPLDLATNRKAQQVWLS